MEKQIIIIPDSFKGSMTSVEVADILASSARQHTGKTCIQIPIADGGEGSVDCILSALGGTKRFVRVKSPENLDIMAYYGVTLEGTAVIEIAESSGLTKQSTFRALRATTYGFGELIKDALDFGLRQFLLCLGGSATTDCGCGMAAALGVRFLDVNGERFIPDGGSLSEISRIDFSGIDSRISESEFIVMTDVESPLYGELGSAYVFAPQKGASPTEVQLLDDGLRHVCRVLEKETGTDYSFLPGGGAAGGVGCGCCAFLGAQLQSGIEAMLRISNFDDKVKDCCLIVTGEGRLDSQSMMGKVLSGIKRHAGEVPVVTFCGSCEMTEKEQEDAGIEVVEISRDVPLKEAIRNGKQYLKEKADHFFVNRKMECETGKGIIL